MSNNNTGPTNHDKFLTAQLNCLRSVGRGISSIELTKRLREETGLSLKEAKDTVEDFLARNCPELQERTNALARGVNVTAALAVVAAILWILWTGGRAWPKDYRDPVGWVIWVGVLVVWLTSRRSRQAAPSPSVSTTSS